MLVSPTSHHLFIAANANEAALFPSLKVRLTAFNLQSGSPPKEQCKED